MMHRRLAVVSLLVLPVVAAARPSTDLTALGYATDGTVDASDAACPGAEDGTELVGTRLPEWSLVEWQNGAPTSLAKLRGRVVVVRFWTAGCRWCEKSLPALQKLADELRGEPVTFVGAFHAKPAADEEQLARGRAAARSWGVTFPLALDRDWRTLRRWFLDGHHRHASSATFVIGKDGRVAFVHPGPVYYPSDAPDAAKANADYVALRRAILTALGRGG
jgi:peroxiredoxin